MGDKDYPVYGGIHNINQQIENQVTYRHNDYLQIHIKQAKNDYSSNPGSDICVPGE